VKSSAEAVISRKTICAFTSGWALTQGSTRRWSDGLMGQSKRFPIYRPIAFMSYGRERALLPRNRRPFVRFRSLNDCLGPWPRNISLPTLAARTKTPQGWGTHRGTCPSGYMGALGFAGSGGPLSCASWSLLKTDSSDAFCKLRVLSNSAFASTFRPSD
jgi:hypothetical protein